uniref:F-box domain-containing protein n=1 Tax=Eptatretus burgeri TaxID=7764 RepID=A0A8C4QEE8_EPTBU
MQEVSQRNYAFAVGPFGVELVERKGTKGSSKMVDVLPENVLLEILTWVPARDLLQSCRLVCRSWSGLIDSKQVIDLLAEGLWEPFLDHQPDIMVTFRYVCLWNGGYCLKFRCRLLAADNETVIAEKILQQNENFVFKNYGSGVRYLVIEHSARHMGNLVTVTVVMVKRSQGNLVTR